MSQLPTVLPLIFIVGLISSTFSKPTIERAKIFEFSSSGIDLASQNLFSISSTVSEKAPIFALTGDDEVENFVTDLIYEDDHSNSTYSYAVGDDLNALLNVEIVSQRPGNFSYQLKQSSSYGRVSTERVYIHSLVTASIATNLEQLLDDDFKLTLRKLPLRYDSTTAEQYEMFFQTYSSHYFTKIQYGYLNNSEQSPDVLVPTGWRTLELYKLLEQNYPKLPSEIIENLKTITETMKLKYEIQCYVEGLQVVMAHSYGKLMRGCYDPVRLSDYFKLKLEEFCPEIDAQFERQCQCAAHSFDRIMELREWFQEPIY